MLYPLLDLQKFSIYATKKKNLIEHHQCTWESWERTLEIDSE